MQVILQKHFYLVFLSLFFKSSSFSLLLELSGREAAEGGDRLVLTPTPTEGFEVERLDRSLAATMVPGAGGGSTGARTANTAANKEGKREKESKKEEGVGERDAGLLFIDSERIPVVEPSAEGRRETGWRANNNA